MRGDAYVLAMGCSARCWPSRWACLPIYPAKGYSVTLPVKDPPWRTRSAHGRRVQAGVLALHGRARRPPAHCRHGRAQRLRPQPEPRALRGHRARVEQLFPGAGDTGRAQFWSGLRPATPSNVPMIGARPSPTCSSTPATARWAGRMPAARAWRSPTSSAAAAGGGFRFSGAAAMDRIAAQARCAARGSRCRRCVPCVRRVRRLGSEHRQHPGEAVQAGVHDLGFGNEADQWHIAQCVAQGAQFGIGAAEQPPPRPRQLM
jgi:hypothetical protein